MAKPFSDIFKDISAGDGLSAVLRDAEVEKISENGNHRVMRLYVTFHTVVPKSGIRTIERKIRDNVFGGRVEVKIVEHFTLGEAYRPEEIYDLYKDSILDELFETDRILYQIVKKATFVFDEDGALNVILPDDGTSRLYEGELLDYLNHVFEKRFNSRIAIGFSYKVPDKNYLSDTKDRIGRQVEEILKTVAEAHKAEEGADGDAIATVGKPSAGAAQKKEGFKGQKGGFQRVPQGRRFQADPQQRPGCGFRK